jgi:hypothetical protein
MADITLNRYNVITFPDNENIDDIVEGIVDGSLNLSEILFSGAIKYGEINFNKFEASVFNLPDVAGEKIQVYQMDNDTKKYLFTGYVDSCKLNEYAYYRDIVAYDTLYTYSGADYDIALWWSAYWEDKTSAKLGDVLRSMLTYFSVPYINVELPLDNYEIGQYSQIQKMSLTDMLQLICTLNMCMPNTNREGYIEFIFLNNPDTTNIIDTYAGGESEFESYTAMLYNKIEIYNENDELIGYYGNGDNAFEIRNNILIYGKSEEDCNTLAEIMYSYLCTTQFIPANIDMIVSNLDIHIGDIVVTSKGNHIVCEQEYYGTLLIDQRLTSRGESINKSQVGYNPEYQRLGLQIELLSKAFENQLMLYLLYDNENAYAITDVETIIDIPFKTSSECYVVFHASVIFNVETSSGEINNVMHFNDGSVQFRFVVNDTYIMDYTPKVTYQDGTYTIHLDYSWYDENNDESINQSFKVVCSIEDCTVTIPTYRIHGYLTADKLFIGSAWDGRLYANDEFGLLGYAMNELIRDEANVTTQLPIPATPSDRVGLLGYIDSTGITSDGVASMLGMIFTTVVNLSLLTYTATISNNTFIDGEVITPAMYDVEQIKVTSNGVAYYVSVDGGITWSAWVEGQWVEGASMTASELESVPTSALQGRIIKVRAVIDSQSSLTIINVKGGHI